MQHPAVAVWPNWVDLIIVIVVARGCYTGFAHGLVAEILTDVGAVAVTALTVNAWSIVLDWLRNWLIRVPPDVLAPAVFWGVFLILLMGLRIVLRRVAGLVKWERLHWTIQGIGMVLGGLRGLWWSGFLVLALTTSGFTYATASVRERSVLGRRLVQISRTGVDHVAQWFPWALERKPLLIPPVNPATP